MRSVIYVDALSTKGLHFRVTVGILAAFSLLTGISLAYESDVTGQQALTFLLFTGATVACVIGRKRWFGVKGEPLYRLRADDAGLTFSAGVSEWHWPWGDVLFVEHSPADSQLDEEIRIGLSTAEDGKAPLELRRTSRGWQLCLLQIFDTPLAEIAATLSTYRDRAMAGGGS